jgi:hypothetical protein
MDQYHVIEVNDEDSWVLVSWVPWVVQTWS